MRSMEIVCGILKNDKGYLIAKRGKGVHENIWEFPGGKVEQGETLEEAIVREFKEELNLIVMVKEYFTSIFDQRKEIELKVHAFLLEYVEGKPFLHVHHEVRYEQVEELKNYPFEKADLPILDALLIYDKKET